MSGEIEYRVKEDTTTEVISVDPIDIVSVPVWTVTRVTAGMGWHIAKYRTAKAAQKAADALAALSGEEVK